MSFFRRKTVPAPPSGPQPQHWVAYMYAPQSLSMPSMYPLQTAGPYLYHVPPNAKYGLHHPTVPVQYIHHQRTSSAYSNTPHLPPPPLPVPQLQRPASAAYSRSGDAFPYSDGEYVVDINTQPAKQGVFSAFINFARGRSKSRGRGEAELIARPRSRGA